MTERSNPEKQKIRKAYHSSRNVYDDVLGQRSLFSRIYTKIFWQGTDDRAVAQKILSWIPGDFSGKLLDVPAGTAVFTAEKWSALTGAEITCLDLSADMLSEAGDRLKNCRNIHLLQGDVGNLPMADGSFDLVVSMNGFHAFPEKERAFREITRVLKPGGVLIACFYIRGQSRVTDLLVRTVLSGKGWFTPPFQTQEEVRKALERGYGEPELHMDGSIVYFKARKKTQDEQK